MLFLDILLLFSLSLGHERQRVVIIDFLILLLAATAEEIILIILVGKCILYSRSTAHTQVIQLIEIVEVVSHRSLWSLALVFIFPEVGPANFGLIHFLLGLSCPFELVSLLSLSLLAL